MRTTASICPSQASQIPVLGRLGRFFSTLAPHAHRYVCNRLGFSRPKRPADSAFGTCAFTRPTEDSARQKLHELELSELNAAPDPKPSRQPRVTSTTARSPVQPSLL